MFSNPAAAALFPLHWSSAFISFLLLDSMTNQFDDARPPPPPPPPEAFEQSLAGTQLLRWLGLIRCGDTDQFN